MEDVEPTVEDQWDVVETEQGDNVLAVVGDRVGDVFVEEGVVVAPFFSKMVLNFCARF